MDRRLVEISYENICKHTTPPVCCRAAVSSITQKRNIIHQFDAYKSNLTHTSYSLAHPLPVKVNARSEYDAYVRTNNSDDKLTLLSGPLNENELPSLN